MKKIAIYINELGMGGIEKSVINLLNRIDTKKYEIDLFIFGENNFYELPKNAKIIKLKKPSSLLRFLPFKISLKIYKPEIPKKEYDLAIDFDSYQFHTAACAIKTKAKKRAIWIHNDIKIKIKEEIKYRILYYFFRKKYDYFDTYCAVSEGALKSFKELKEKSNKKYMVIPNYINTDEIKEKMKEPCEIKIDKNKINIITVGRLCHQKGIDIMLKEIKELTKHRQDFHLYIVGSGEEEEKLKKIKSDLELEQYVTFTGGTKNPFKYLKEMDLFYLSSRYEGQGMVLLEALSVGIDVLIPTHLEKYCPIIKAEKNILKYLKEYKKHKKKEYNPLTEYNEEITKKLEELFTSE